MKTLNLTLMPPNFLELMSALLEQILAVSHLPHSLDQTKPLAWSLCSLQQLISLSPAAKIKGVKRLFLLW